MMKKVILMTTILSIMIFGGYSKAKEVENTKIEGYTLVEDYNDLMEIVNFTKDLMTFDAVYYTNQLDPRPVDLEIWDVTHGYTTTKEYGQIKLNWRIEMVYVDNNVRKSEYIDVNCHSRHNVKYILWEYRNAMSPCYMYAD